jgi:hypothetical protein
VRYLAIRTLLRLAEGLDEDPAVWDYSAFVAAHERHRTEVLSQPVPTDPVDAAAALLHAIVRLHPLAYALLGPDDVTVRPPTGKRGHASAENGDLDEPAIAAQLAASALECAVERSLGLNMARPCAPSLGAV